MRAHFIDALKRHGQSPCPRASRVPRSRCATFSSDTVVADNRARTSFNVLSFRHLLFSSDPIHAIKTSERINGPPNLSSLVKNVSPTGGGIN